MVEKGRQNLTNEFWRDLNRLKQAVEKYGLLVCNLIDGVTGISYTGMKSVAWGDFLDDIIIDYFNDFDW